MRKSTVILVFIAFFTPVLLAIVLHSRWTDWMPDAGTNHGELITPVVPVGHFSAIDQSGTVIAHDTLLGQWQLVLIWPGECGETCIERLYWMRQIRTAQNQHSVELGLILVTGEAVSDRTANAIGALASDLLIFESDHARAFAAAFPEPFPDGSIYILDPLGNIIMRYPQDADPTGIRKDLRRLLTWTKR